MCLGSLYTKALLTSKDVMKKKGAEDRAQNFSSQALKGGKKANDQLQKLVAILTLFLWFHLTDIYANFFLVCALDLQIVL